MALLAVSNVEQLLKSELKKEGFGTFPAPNVLGWEPDIYILFEKKHFLDMLLPPANPDNWLAEIYFSKGACEIIWNKITNPEVNEEVIAVLKKISENLKLNYGINITITIPEHIR